MGWRGPEYSGDFPTLGWEIGQWVQDMCAIPDGDKLGERYLLTDEMWAFLAWHYRVKPDADADRWQSAWAYRRSQLVRPQKWGKGPFSAALICVEAIGPVRFAGWDAAGEPVGRPWETPWIQVAAASEDQTANVYRALVPMIQESPSLSAEIPDTGETRINLRGGGRIEPVTSASRSRLGQRVTFCVMDETGLWLEANGGVKLAETIRRGLSGMGGRSIETTNAWDPSEQSVAQRTSEALVKDVYRDHRIPPAASLGNKAERRKALKVAYGDSAGADGWVDLDRIDGELLEIAEKDPAQAERFYMNRIVAGTGAWLDGDWWDSRRESRVVEPGTRVVGGFDGSDMDDWTGIRLETLDGYQFTPTYGPDKRPTIWNPAEWGKQVPRLEVAAAVEEIMGRYDVVRLYCDPPYWDSEVDAWADKYGDKRVVRWYTGRPTQMHAASERLVTDVMKKDSPFRHDGCLSTGIHVRNARKAARPGDRYALRKAGVGQKIDLAVCSILAHEAAGDAVSDGLARPRKSGRMVVLR